MSVWSRWLRRYRTGAQVIETTGLPDGFVPSSASLTPECKPREHTTKPLNRIQRLREHTPGPIWWAWTRRCDFWGVEPDHEHGDGCWSWVVYDAAVDNGPLAECPTPEFAQHITRWAGAAEAALDLVQMVLTDHEPCKQFHPSFEDLSRPVRMCHRCDEDWPCKRGAAAVALLDVLDPLRAAA